MSQILPIEPVLEAKDLSVVYGGRRVLDVPSIQVFPNKVTAIIGPNGSGKTTLLLCLALLLRPTAGNIFYQRHLVPNGTSVMQMRRRFAVVFQEPLLLNATVWDNVTLGMRLRGISRPEIKDRAQHWLERFGIAHLSQRNARTLSGGEAQRTSLARAFVLQPDVLFMDEPFAALDVPSRQSLFGDIANILKETKFATILVTHDRNEAQTLANRIIVLINGNIVQSGTPREIFSSPVSREIARFVGMENILEGTVISNKDCAANIDVKGVKMEGVSSCQTGGKVYVCIRPEDISISLDKSSAGDQHVYSGRITSMILSEPLVRINLDCGFPLVSLITKALSDELKLEVGKTVCASLKVKAIHIISVN